MSATLDRLLETLPDVYAQLGDALHGTRGGTDSERVTGGGGNERPAPLQLQVAEHRHELLRGVRYWLARGQNELRTETRARAGQRLATGVAWLMAHAHQLPETSRRELYANLAGWHRRARVLTDRPRLRGRLPLGACLNTSELWACEGTVWAMLPADKGAPVYLTCQDCGGRWDVTELPAARDVRLPVHEVAELLDVSVRTIQRRTADRDAGTVRLGDALAAQ